MAESRIEKEFRHRQMFLADMHTYQLVMIAGIWLSLNHMMKINRDRVKREKIIAEAGKEKPVELLDEDKKKPESPAKSPDQPPKSAADKKND